MIWWIKEWTDRNAAEASKKGFYPVTADIPKKRRTVPKRGTNIELAPAYDVALMILGPEGIARRYGGLIFFSTKIGIPTTVRY